MNIRKCLLSVLVSGSFVLPFVGFVSESQAASGQALQPGSNWAISKITGKKEGADSYCAMARRYSGDLILTFARNSRDESSVAIDFQREALSKTQSYYVTLKPGFEQDRSFDVHPVSGKALVVRLGQDYAFYDSMNRSGQLTVDISGENYIFAMPDWAQGLQELNSCLAVLTEPAAGKDPDPIFQEIPPVDSPAGVSGDIPDPVFSAQDTQALREENVRLRNALERERRTYEERFMSHDEGSSIVSEMTEKMQILEQENIVLRQQTVSLPAVVSSCQEETATANASAALNQSMNQDMAMLRDENEWLRSEIEKHVGQLALLEAQGTGNERSQIASAEAATINRLRDRVNELESENADMRLSLRDISSVSGTQNGIIKVSQLRSVEEQLRLVESERDRLAQKVQGVYEGKEDHLLSISTDNWNLEQATRRFNESEREIRRLGGQLEQARAQCTREKREIEYMLFDPEIAEQEQIAKLLELENTAAQATVALETQTTTYEQRIASLEQELSANETTVLDAQSRVTAMQSELEEARYAALQTPPVEFESIRQERDMLAQQVSEMRSENHTLQRSLSAIKPAAGDSRVSSDIKPAIQQRQPAVSAAPSVQSLEAQEQSFVEARQLISAPEMQEFLGQAGITITDSVKEVPSSGAGFVAYSWDTGALFGSAEQKVMESDDAFDGYVSAYLKKTESRCQGDFAAVPVADDGAAGSRFSAYEIACIGQTENASASLVFFSRDGLFTTIAHEGGLQGMDIAMDARDRLLSMLMGTKIASK